jgi:nitrogen regulatory protein PII
MNYVDAVIEAITIVAQKDGDKGCGKIFIIPI